MSTGPGLTPVDTVPPLSCPRVHVPSEARRGKTPGNLADFFYPQLDRALASRNTRLSFDVPAFTHSGTRCWAQSYPQVVQKCPHTGVGLVRPHFLTSPAARDSA